MQWCRYGRAPLRITTADATVRSNLQSEKVPSAPSATITPAPTVLEIVQPRAATSALPYTHSAAAESASTAHSSSRSRPPGTSIAAVWSPWWTSTTPDSPAVSPDRRTTGPPLASIRTAPGGPAADSVTSFSSRTDSAYVPGLIVTTSPLDAAAMASPMVR